MLFVLCIAAIFSQGGTAQPVELITILSPGAGSIVSSPIEIRAFLSPGEDGLVRVSVVDDHNNLLARHAVRAENSEKDYAEFAIDIPFEIPNEPVNANLIIATWDKQHRPIAERTVGLTLQNFGETTILEQRNIKPWLTMEQPQPGDVIDASPVIVKGSVTPLNNAPVFFVLMNEFKGELVVRQLPVNTPGIPIDFKIDLPFILPLSNHNLRLIIKQADNLNGSNIILDSFQLLFIP